MERGRGVASEIGIWSARYEWQGLTVLQEDGKDEGSIMSKNE